MWPSNGYHGHGNGNGSGSFHTPANFQHSYSPDDGFIPFPAPSSGGFDQQFSPQAVQELLYTSDGEGYIPSFQPTVGLYNEGGLMQQNSYFSSASPVSILSTCNPGSGRISLFWTFLFILYISMFIRLRLRTNSVFTR
jgi:hypothetical protein